MWDGRGAVPVQHPRTFPLHPVCAQSGQQKLRDTPVHSGLRPAGERGCGFLSVLVGDFFVLWLQESKKSCQAPVCGVRGGLQESTY